MKCTMKAARVLTLAGSFLFALAARVSAQCPGGAPRVGDIGITRVECDCDIARPDSRAEWTFRTEPRVLRIEPGSAADGRVEVGDRIVSVNGHAITTRAGASAFARLHPSQPVALTVRRGDGVHDFLINPASVCASSATLLGMSPATQRVQVTAAHTAQGIPVRSGTPSAQGTGVVSIRGTPARTAARVTASDLRIPATGTPAWIGIAFRCDDCSVIVERGAPRWSFTTPPDVYAVEPGSPAHRAGIRRGDVITHVDNHAITSEPGGSRWASIQPGQTVRVRYRRGDAEAVRTATFQAGKPRGSYVPAQTTAVVSELRALEATLATRDSATTRLLRSYEGTLRRQMTEQAQMLSELRTHLSSKDERERREAETKLHGYLELQDRLRAEQETLYREVARVRAVEVEQSAVTRQALEGIASKVSPVTSVRVQGSMHANEQRLRYSGTVRNAEVEVRGATPVVVTERGNELIITTHDATIIIRVPDRE